jgi:hypothetical protein
MTLRDVGKWLTSVWDGAVADLQTVLSSSPLDWPLWVFPAGFVVGFVIIPLAFGKMLAEVRNYSRNEPPMGLGWCIGFTVGASLCLLVVVDLYLTKRIYDGAEPAPRLLFFAYPIMTLLFGFFSVSEWRKQLRVWRERR